ncbi:hypothetical protein D3C87_1882330 [compost metagenome]
MPVRALSRPNWLVKCVNSPFTDSVAEVMIQAWPGLRYLENACATDSGAECRRT